MLRLPASCLRADGMGATGPSQLSHHCCNTAPAAHFPPGCCLCESLPPLHLRASVLAHLVLPPPSPCRPSFLPPLLLVTTSSWQASTTPTIAHVICHPSCHPPCLSIASPLPLPPAVLTPAPAARWSALPMLRRCCSRQQHCSLGHASRSCRSEAGGGGDGWV